MSSAVVEPTPSLFHNPLLRYFAATRPAFLSASLTAVLLGLASARHDNVQPHLGLAVITLLLALLVHAAVNVLNDYYDALNGTDEANTERLFPFTGGSRFIQNGVLSRAQTAIYGYLLLSLAILGGCWLVLEVGTGLLWIGMVGLFIGWAYSATPLKLNSRGLGEFCVLSGFLGVVIGADYVQRQTFSLTPFLVGLPYALLATNLLFINQFPDRKADAAAGKHHWVVRLPLPLAAKIYPIIAGLALVAIVAMNAAGTLPAVALLSALPLLFSFRAAVILARHAGTPAALLPAIRLTLIAMLSHGILMAGLLLWSRS
ncbi:1,4-dihydroxy-2-naphthoate octaprenyltransferase [Novimethylophilus kurashikiensis]|uniref:1,4-dihydroxy-2-naphthoate octaprenyltransferase n=1 Tax=Novimethylophilus kurashikiensis TaxID=1825523 RepID=A0A2R5F6M2_9PROT|nr:prenyltransferase [Novimethylophilus kurashikiensis]GBG13906.1 1,4-dihydroxy-2-naphthoate octaprenyltransferase [Novimethylophilus kurashikiensis]